MICAALLSEIQQETSKAVLPPAGQIGTHHCILYFARVCVLSSAICLCGIKGRS